MPSQATSSPGWPEDAVALITYVAMTLVLSVFWCLRIPDEQAAWRGTVGMAMNDVAGAIALLAAVAIRIRDVRVFGSRKAPVR